MSAHRRRRAHAPALVAASLAAALATTLAVAPRPPASGRAGCEHAASAGTLGTTGPDSTSSLALLLNIPAFRLDVVVDGAIERSIAVAVGEPRYPTPVGDFAVTRIVWHPWWVPPPSDWARDDTVTPPGPDNPMGSVKLLVDDAYYIHGTPAPASIGRASSHGCIRVRDEDAIALAQLVERWAGTRDSGDAAAAPRVGDSLLTRTVELVRPVRVSIVYELVERRGDSLLVHPDVYHVGHDSLGFRALAALAAAGLDTTRIDRARLAALLARGRTRATAVHLDSLLDPSSAPTSGSAPLDASTGRRP